MRPPAPTIDAVRVDGDEATWRRAAREGRVVYRIEARNAVRRRTHLQSAKILDSGGAFICEAMILDASETGLRLLLARDCGLPARFGLHVDLTGALATAATIWRRDRLVGARLLSRAPPAPLKRSFRAALRGRYYAVPG